MKKNRENEIYKTLKCSMQMPVVVLGKTGSGKTKFIDDLILSVEKKFDSPVTKKSYPEYGLDLYRQKFTHTLADTWSSISLNLISSFKSIVKDISDEEMESSMQLIMSTVAILKAKKPEGIFLSDLLLAATSKNWLLDVIESPMETRKQTETPSSNLLYDIKWIALDYYNDDQFLYNQCELYRNYLESLIESGESVNFYENKEYHVYGEHLTTHPVELTIPSFKKDSKSLFITCQSEEVVQIPGLYYVVVVDKNADGGIQEIRTGFGA